MKSLAITDPCFREMAACVDGRKHCRTINSKGAPLRATRDKPYYFQALLRLRLLLCQGQLL